jgi:hypothetical protein
MRYLGALKEARDTFALRNKLDRQQKVDAAVSLGEWGIFSNRNIAKFAGLDPSVVNGVLSNPARNGGRLTPEALPTLIEIIHTRIRGEINTNLVRLAVQQGVSVNYLAKLTGLPQRTVARWVDKDLAA